MHISIHCLEFVYYRRHLYEIPFTPCPSDYNPQHVPHKLYIQHVYKTCLQFFLQANEL